MDHRARFKRVHVHPQQVNMDHRARLKRVHARRQQAARLQHLRGQMPRLFRATVRAVRGYKMELDTDKVIVDEEFHRLFKVAFVLDEGPPAHSKMLTMQSNGWEKLTFKHMVSTLYAAVSTPTGLHPKSSETVILAHDLSTDGLPGTYEVAYELLESSACLTRATFDASSLATHLAFKMHARGCAEHGADETIRADYEYERFIKATETVEDAIASGRTLRAKLVSCLRDESEASNQGVECIMHKLAADTFATEVLTKFEIVEKFVMMNKLGAAVLLENGTGAASALLDKLFKQTVPLCHSVCTSYSDPDSISCGGDVNPVPAALREIFRYESCTAFEKHLKATKKFVNRKEWMVIMGALDNGTDLCNQCGKKLERLMKGAPEWARDDGTLREYFQMAHCGKTLRKCMRLVCSAPVCTTTAATTSAEAVLFGSKVLDTAL